MINYLEDYQLDELKSLIGGKTSYYTSCVKSPTGAGVIVEVGKSVTTFKSVVKEYCENKNGKVGVKYTVPNRIAWNIIG